MARHLDSLRVRFFRWQDSTRRLFLSTTVNKSKKCAKTARFAGGCKPSLPPETRAAGWLPPNLPLTIPSGLLTDRNPILGDTDFDQVKLHLLEPGEIEGLTSTHRKFGGRF